MAINDRGYTDSSSGMSQLSVIINDTTIIIINIIIINHSKYYTDRQQVSVRLITIKHKNNHRTQHIDN